MFRASMAMAMASEAVIEEVKIARQSIFSETIFTQRYVLAPSAFIKAMHPKTEILPEPSAIARILENGWVAQSKIHGHRAQIHLSADANEPLIAYTRQGMRHKLHLSPEICHELRRLFSPQKGWNVIDTEWLKPKEKLFIFDFLKCEGVLLRSNTFPERWARLPQHFISPHIKVLPILRDQAACLKVLASAQPEVEGLVFKSSRSTGFSDSSIVRCRKRK